MCELQIRLRDEVTTSPCACCDDVSRRVWGDVQAAGTIVAVYFVHWTVGRIFEYGAHFDLIFGPWGEGTSAADRVVVRPHHRLDQSGVMVIDARDEFRTVAANALTRSDVIGTPRAVEVFAVYDAIVLWDPRLAALVGAADESVETPLTLR